MHTLGHEILDSRGTSGKHVEITHDSARPWDIFPVEWHERIYCLYLVGSTACNMSAPIRSSLRTTLSKATASSSLGLTRNFGFHALAHDPNAPGPSRWADEARNPVVRDSLVPIVVEQTVNLLSTSLMPELTIRQEEKGVMIYIPGSCANESSFSVQYVPMAG